MGAWGSAGMAWESVEEGRCGHLEGRGHRGELVDVESEGAQPLGEAPLHPVAAEAGLGCQGCDGQALPLPLDVDSGSGHGISGAPRPSGVPDASGRVGLIEQRGHGDAEQASARRDVISVQRHKLAQPVAHRRLADAGGGGELRLGDARAAGGLGDADVGGDATSDGAGGTHADHGIRAWR